MNYSKLIGTSGKVFSGKDIVGKLIMMHIANANKENTWHFKPQDVNDTYWLNNEWAISDISGFEIKKYAYKLKLIISILTGVPVSDLEKAEVKKSKLGKEWDYLLWYNEQKMLRVNPNMFKDYDPNRLKNYTFREALTHIGTELFRNQFHDDVWVNALFADYKPTYNIKNTITEDTAPNWIITDVRFNNEAEAIIKRGGLLIRVENPEYFPYENEHISETALDNYEHFSVKIINDKSKGLEYLSDVVLDILKSYKII